MFHNERQCTPTDRIAWLPSSPPLLPFWAPHTTSHSITELHPLIFVFSGWLFWSLSIWHMVGIHCDRTDPVIPFGGFSENVKYQEVVSHNRKQLTKYFVDAMIVINPNDEHQHHHHHHHHHHHLHHHHHQQPPADLWLSSPWSDSASTRDCDEILVRWKIMIIVTFITIINVKLPLRRH